MKTKLQKMVEDCVTAVPLRDDALYYPDLGRYEYIRDAQARLNILPEYRIIRDEWSLAQDVISCFQKDLVQQYFLGELSVPKSGLFGYTIFSKDCFMYWLLDYLSDLISRECRLYSCESRKLFYKTSNIYGTPPESTNFQIVMEKLRYISYMHCKHCKALNPKGDYYPYEESLEKNIRDLMTRKENEFNVD